MPTVGDAVPSVTIAVKCPAGTVRTVIHEDGFIQVLAGKTGTEGSSTAFAIGVLVSYINVSKIGSLKDVADLLRGVSTDASNRLVFPALSIPDAISQALYEYIRLQKEEEDEKPSS